MSGGDDGVLKIWDLRQFQKWVHVHFCLYKCVCEGGWLRGVKRDGVGDVCVFMWFAATSTVTH